MSKPKHIGSHKNDLTRGVLPELLKFDPDNDREYDINETEMQALRKSVEAEGILSDLLIFDDGTVHNGNRRLFVVNDLVANGAWKHNPELPAKIIDRPKTEIDMIISRINLNEAQQFPPLAQGRYFAKMRGQKMSNSQIAERTPWSKMHIGNMLQLHDAPEEVRELVKTGTMSARMAYESLNKSPALITRAAEIAKEMGAPKIMRRHFDAALAEIEGQVGVVDAEVIPGETVVDAVVTPEDDVVDAAISPEEEGTPIDAPTAPDAPDAPPAPDDDDVPFDMLPKSDQTPGNPTPANDAKPGTEAPAPRTSKPNNDPQPLSPRKLCQAIVPFMTDLVAALDSRNTKEQLQLLKAHEDGLREWYDNAMAAGLTD